MDKYRAELEKASERDKRDSRNGLSKPDGVIIFPALLTWSPTSDQCPNLNIDIADSECLRRTQSVISAGVDKLRQRAMVGIMVSSSDASSTFK
jgi:hypothetical protein